MSNIEAVETWLANCHEGDEILWHQLEDNSRELERVANRNAAFAHVWERLKRERGVYLAIDNMGRCIATRLAKPH
jgi:hypothetical protein